MPQLVCRDTAEMQISSMDKERRKCWAGPENKLMVENLIYTCKKIYTCLNLKFTHVKK